MNVIMAGGGTAGHVFPALAVADELRGRGDRVTFVGTGDGPEAALVPAAVYRFVPVRAISAQTRLSLRSVHALTLAFTAARSLRPLVAAADIVVGIGGFASAPAALAARWTRRPLVLIEQNSVPGAVNRIAARWAGAIATTFEASRARLPADRRVVRTGNPIRREIAGVPANRGSLVAEARDRFGLEEGRSTVVVLGGSQGALHVDQVVADAIPLLEDRMDLQLLVSAGPGHEGALEGTAAAARIPVRVEPFIERMDLALAVADLALSRAGASVAELAACGVPAILVPYPHATENHQEANARELVEAGAATMILDAELSPSGLASAILDLMDDDRRRGTMAEAALAWARPDAAARIADLVREIASEAAS